MSTLLDDLRGQIEKGQVVVLVGTGVSIGATLAGDPPAPAAAASWVGLLHSGVERCLEVAKPVPAEWVERVRGQIDSGDVDDLLTAAQKIATKLGARDGEYERWLRDSVGELRVANPGVLEALRDLGLPLATTNYDGLIEEVTGLPPVTWRGGRQVERVLRGEEAAVLHLHGYWGEPESVIFELGSYLALLGDGQAQAMVGAMREAKTLLFVGFGAGPSDPSFGALLKWAREIFSGSEFRHFLLCRTSELDELRAAHTVENRIFPLPFGDEHRDLAPFLRSLIPARAHSAAPAASAHSTAASRLPKPPRGFTGRDALLKRLVEAILQPCAAPVPVLGAAGIGKTALTLAALHDLRVEARFGDRRYFARCEIATDRQMLVSELARALALKLEGKPDEALLAELARAPILLVLDNAETPLNGDHAAVEGLLHEMAALPGVALVASIREDKHTLGSWVEAIRVPPLVLEHSRKVFLAAAGDEHRNDPHLDNLVKALDGVPLALQLVGRQAVGEPDLAGVWQRLQPETTRLLKRGAGKTRLAGVEFSLELVITSARMRGRPEALRLLKLLARLPDGAAHQDLETLLPNDALSAAATLHSAALAFDEGSRLGMLAPVREYMQRAHAPEAVDLQRLARFYVALFDSEGRKVGAEGGEAAVQRLAPEVANLEALANSALPTLDNEEVRGAIFSYGEFARHSGYGSARFLEQVRVECERNARSAELALCIETLGDVALSRSDLHAAKSLYEKAIVLHRDSGSLERQAWCIQRLGDLAFRRSEFDTARARYDEALPFYRQAGNLLGQASCLKGFGDVALRRAEFDTARARYDEALPLFRQAGSLRGAANCIQGLGDLALGRSDLDAAPANYDEALSLYRQVGDLLQQANCIKGLGDVALRRSEFDTARARYDEALPLYRQAGSLGGAANCVEGLGDLALGRSDLDTAPANYDEALSLYRQAGDLLGQANCIKGLGDVALRRSEFDTARERYDEALPLYRQAGDLLGQANCIKGLGDVALRRSEFDTARARYDEALPLYRQVGDLLGQANCIKGLGDVALRRSEFDTARERYDEALPLYRQAGSLLGRANCIQALGDLAEAQELLPDAVRAFEEALRMYAAAGAPYSVGSAHHRLARVVTDPEGRRAHVEAARAAWHGVGREDLIKDYLAAFDDPA